jgi:hypothetical protein
MPRHITGLGVALLVLAGGPGTAPAQQVVLGAKQPNGSWTLTIDGASFLALPIEIAKRIRILDDSLTLLVQQLRIRDSMLALQHQSDSAEVAYREHLSAYASELELQVDRYRDLASGYKRLSNMGRTLTFEAALGASGSDTEPAILAGFGLRSVRVFGFLQKDNFGGLIGMSLPIW